ncbi:hypothetical protein P7K49_034231, partial [Saguinus oedipus]
NSPEQKSPRQGQTDPRQLEKHVEQATSSVLHRQSPAEETQLVSLTLKEQGADIVPSRSKEQISCIQGADIVHSRSTSPARHRDLQDE